MPPSTHTAPDGAQLSAFALTARIVAIAFFTFICYLAIGLPLAVLPGYVHGQLGYGSVLAGLAISVQYAATLLSRSHAGRMADTVPRRPPSSAWRPAPSARVPVAGLCLRAQRVAQPVRHHRQPVGAGFRRELGRHGRGHLGHRARRAATPRG